MGIYICSRCDNYRDSHEHGAYEDPDEKFGLICEGCMENLDDEEYDRIMGNETP